MPGREEAAGVRSGLASPVSGEVRLALSLFVTDGTPSSTRARSQLERWYAETAREGVVLEIIDTRDRPDLAEAERVLATPALIRHVPPPRRKIVGDLGDWQAVIDALDLGGAAP